MSGRHARSTALSSRSRRFGAVAVTTTALAGSGLGALAGSAVAAPVTTPVAAPVAAPVPKAPVAKAPGAPAAKAAPTAPSLVTGRMAVAEARKHIGAPYRYGAEGPKAFDCSGLTQFVYGKLGVTLPRSAAQQQDAVHAVPARSMQPGDLIFEGRNAHHVAIYAGNGQMITAPESGENVKLDGLPSSFTAGRPS